MRRAIGCSFFVCLLAACGGGGSPTSPGSSTGSTGSTTTGSGSGTLTAVIDGQSWASDSTTARAETNLAGRVTLVGTRTANNGEAVTITIAYITGPGTYPLGVNFDSTPGGNASFTQAITTWLTPFDGASGSITITSVSSSRITGTFTFNAAANPGSGTKAVTNGVFDVPFRTPFTVGTDRGSKVSGAINGAPWNAATISAQGSGTVFGFTASNTAYNLTLGPQAFVAGNTYPMGIGVGKATLTVILQGGALGVWGQGFSDAGSVTINTFSGGRASGTFSATLAPQGVTSGGFLVISGTFDIRVN